MRARPMGPVPGIALAVWLALGCTALALAEQPGAVPDAAGEADPGPAAAVPTAEELESLGAVIGRIRVVPGEIFDTSIPGESGWLYRTANKLHISTRPSIVRKQLLFASGEPYRKRLIEETERLLRSNDYLYDATVVPVAFDGQTVDLEVRTRDVWTLNPGFSFGREGGENKIGAQLEEKNLLGTGQQLKFEWNSNVDRESLSLTFFDPHFLDGFNRLELSYVDSDDGETKILRLERPFYALDTRRAAGLRLADNQRNDSRYVLGERVGEFEHRAEYHEIYGGRSEGLRGSEVTRWTYGLTYHRDRFAPAPGEPLGGPLPGDRELLYPWLGVEYIQDRYQERRNLDQIRRTEDVLVGLRASARLGLAADGLASDRNALVLGAALQDGTDLSPGHSIFGHASVSGRLEQDGIRNGLLVAEGRYYLQTSRRSKFYASASGALTEQLDEELQLLLGGDSGLRGYPLRYQAGTARALLTLEQRYYTDWYPFRLFHVGGAAFFDVGRTWGRDVTGAQSIGWLKDLGVGLRLGSSRSSFGNVIHIDLAFPLDGDESIDSVQLLVETKGSF
jgi:hypothetical protein